MGEKMDTPEALRSIRYDLVEYIQKKVCVVFDDTRHAPVTFTYCNKRYVVEKVLFRLRTASEQPVNAYLIQVNGDEVYFLYFHFHDLNDPNTVREGCWVLCFRILNDHEIMALYREERKMLLNMHLKRVVDFHGHLCPDLVIGCKLCEYAKKLFSPDSDFNNGISVIAENRTSSLDAIQILLGTTIGNQRLHVMDIGKHNYTLLSKVTEFGFRLSLKQRHYNGEEEYHRLERKILNNLSVMDDVVQFQKLLDSRVQCLLGLIPEILFHVRHVESVPPPFETANAFSRCSICGEQVQESHKIDYKDTTYCISCFRQMTMSSPYYTVQ
jgi:formylmethanofuran dehydrogenase subunit E